METKNDFGAYLGDYGERCCEQFEQFGLISFAASDTPATFSRCIILQLNCCINSETIVYIPKDEC